MFGAVVVKLHQASESPRTGMSTLFLCRAGSQIFQTFGGHTASIPTTQLCCCSVKVAINNMYTNGHGCVPKFYFQKQVVGWIWSMGHRLPTPGLEKGSMNTY